jgi:4-hydroxythreonine-4-phosphate dehydrogenase
VMNIHPFERPGVDPGKQTVRAGKFAGDAITASAKLCIAGVIDGMVTAPVSKRTMVAAGYRFPGQTELVASLSGKGPATMMLIADTFRVGLATVHVPLRMVSRRVSHQLIVQRLTAIQRALKQDFGIRRPNIAVLGLNPHAGEEGLLGSEETGIISPAIRRARANGIRAEGPFPADGFFGTHSHRNFDAVLAMYHDQGLIPLKMSGFSIGVNYSAGLPLVRTSPDHGTAFGIAGKGIADPGSMIEAIRLAAAIIHNRKKRR